MNMPLTVLTTLGVIFFMPLKKVEGDWRMYVSSLKRNFVTCTNSKVRKLKAVDFIGILLALAGTIVIMMGLTWGGGEYPWDSAHVIATLVIGFVVCVAFVVWQWKGPRFPLVPRTLLSP